LWTTAVSNVATKSGSVMVRAVIALLLTIATGVLTSIFVNIGI